MASAGKRQREVLHESRRHDASPSPMPPPDGRMGSGSVFNRSPSSYSPFPFFSPTSADVPDGHPPSGERPSHSSALRLSGSGVNLSAEFELNESLMISEDGRKLYKMELDEEIRKNGKLKGRVAALESSVAGLHEQASRVHAAAQRREAGMQAETDRLSSENRALSSESKRQRVGSDEDVQVMPLRVVPAGHDTGLISDPHTPHPTPQTPTPNPRRSFAPCERSSPQRLPNPRYRNRPPTLLQLRCRSAPHLPPAHPNSSTPTHQPWTQNPKPKTQNPKIKPSPNPPTNFKFQTPYPQAATPSPIQVSELQQRASLSYSAALDEIKVTLGLQP